MCIRDRGVIGLPTQAMGHAIALKLELDHGVWPQPSCSLATHGRQLAERFKLPLGFRIQDQALQFAGALQHEA